MRTIVGIGLAGAVGALSRYGLEGLISHRLPGSFPSGTFVINVTGSFVLGFLFVVLTERIAASPALRTSLMVGFVGAYTTFSTFSFETVRLIEDGALRTAALNVAETVVLGLLAVWAGMTVGRAI
ncbi:MAG: fluoride efflux transporter CrcB [Actinomycetota bacterium]